MVEEESETKIEVPKKEEVRIGASETEKEEERVEIPIAGAQDEEKPEANENSGMKELSLAPVEEPEEQPEPVREALPAAEPEEIQEPKVEVEKSEPAGVEEPEEQPEKIQGAQPRVEPEEIQAPEIEESKPVPAAQEAEESKIELIEGAAPSPSDAEAMEFTDDDAIKPPMQAPQEDLPDVHKRWATRDALPARVELEKPRELSREEQVQEAIRLHQENNEPKGFLARIRKIVGW